MVLLLNVIFGLLAYFAVKFMFIEVGASKQVAILVAVISGIVVFLLNLGAQVI